MRRVVNAQSDPGYQAATFGFLAFMGSPQVAALVRVGGMMLQCYTSERVKVAPDVECVNSLLVD